jgi:uncharacterized protein YjbI with pentapeptide repeats
MANPEHVALLRQGSAGWNKWRGGNPGLDIDLSRADLDGANLKGAKLSGADLSHANLDSADLREATLYDATLIGADLGRANLDSADLSYADASRANFSGASLNGTKLTGATLDAALLTGASGMGTAHFACAGMQRARLHESDLRDSNLMSANLDEADLRDSDLSGAQLREATLRGAKLARSCFKGANLALASLDGASLVASDLRGAVLRSASLLNTDLRRARLRGALLTGVQLRGAKGLEFSQLGGPVGDAEACLYHEAVDAYRRLKNYFRDEGRHVDEGNARFWEKSMAQKAAFCEALYGVPYIPRGLFGKCRVQRVWSLLGIDGDRQWKREPEDQLIADLLPYSPRTRLGALLAWSSSWLWGGFAGFGERPKRTLFWVVTLIVAFALVYYSGSWGLGPVELHHVTAASSHPVERMLDSLYFSVVTFVTLGFGDVYPTNAGGKAVVILEVLLGYASLGTLMALVARKSTR